MKIYKDFPLFENLLLFLGFLINNTDQLKNKIKGFDRPPTLNILIVNAPKTNCW